MAYLINRSTSAKTECLHSLLSFLYDSFGVKGYFTLNDAKFDRENKNVHAFCPLLKSTSLGIKCCPFLDNALDEAGCIMTHQKEGDSTKSKQVSDTINTMHALGLVTRKRNNVIITKLGEDFALAKTGSIEYQKLLEKAVLSYGPCIGVLKQAADASDGKGGLFKANDIYVGFPDTQESVIYNGKLIAISSGSKRDSNTRTRSTILTLLTAAGYIQPANLPDLLSGELPHSKYSDYINDKHNSSSYRLLRRPPYEHQNDFVVERPLSFMRLSKQTRSLREKGQGDIRSATLDCQEKLLNRRFAIVFLLNRAFKQGKPLSISYLIEYLRQYPEYFVISNDSFESAMYEDLQVADMVGIPFYVDNEKNLHPLTGLNEKELNEDVPSALLEILGRAI